MSIGIHRLWKDHFVRSLDPGRGDADGEDGWKILDIAGGTGDIAFRLLEHASKLKNDNRTTVTVADINSDMIAEGRKRALLTPWTTGGRLQFIEANAESMPIIPTNSVDLYTVAFGIRSTSGGVSVRYP